MRISRFAVIASPTVAASIALSATAHAEPTTLQQFCDAQSWPRPVTDVVGKLFDPVINQISAGEAGGALVCWDSIRSFNPDGQESHDYGPQRITAVSPPPGTTLGRHDLVTLQLTPIDYKAPPAFRPCDWVTASEAAGFLGVPEPVKTETLDDRAGSVDVQCVYRSPSYGHAVSSELLLPGAFPVDAASEYASQAGEHPTAVSGLGVRAQCHTNPHGVQDRPYTKLVVLLDGSRMYKATGWGAEPCEVLKQFAQMAIGRV